MAKKPKKSTRGNRYSPQQKAEILAYVDAVNAEKGRGGAAAASRKFEISQITIGMWIKKTGKSTTGGSGKHATISSTDFAEKLHRLTSIHEAICKKEAELETLKSEYETLKKSL